MFQFQVEESEDASKILPFSIGDRIHVESHLGTVRYLGEVHGYSGQWLGVEWDDPSRGKHCGSVKGTEYFSVAIPNSASFVRLGVAQKVRTSLEALKERYNYDEQTEVKSIEDRLDKKKMAFKELRVINLGCKGISYLDQEMSALCPLVEVLEINDNHIQDWGSVGTLCKGWTRLKTLDLSRNPLRPPSVEDVKAHKSSFPNLESVILGGVGYTWNNILEASEMWPNITLLTVPCNRITSLTSPTTTLLKINSLDLEKNEISDWTEILKVGCLTKLEYLNLCGNKLTSIIVSDTSLPLFPALRRLNISENCLQNWPSVNELDKLPNIQELRMDINPILNHHNRGTNRQIIIARLPRLLKLEGVDIVRQERRDAEVDYVKLYSHDWSDKSERDSFTKEHPNFFTIVKKHGLGDLEDEASTTTNSNSMQTSLLRLIIVAESGIAGRREIEKRILKTMSVQKLKALLQRTFALPRVPIQITATSCRNPEIKFHLDNDFMEVGQFSLEDGDTLRLHW